MPGDYHGGVPIEKVEVGDEVQSHNAKTGELENEPVTALTPQHKDSLLELRIEGERDPLRPSTHHPFWVKRGEILWTSSSKLVIYVWAICCRPSWALGAGWSDHPLEGQETVYNFTVDKDHDYFVGETGFLVHNAGGAVARRTGTITHRSL